MKIVKINEYILLIITKRNVLETYPRILLLRLCLKPNDVLEVYLEFRWTKLIV